MEEQTGGNVAHDVKAGAREALDAGKERTRSFFEDQKDVLASKVSGFASALHESARNLENQGQGRGTAILADRVASSMERLARSMEGRDLNGMLGETEHFARRSPAAFVGGAVTAGFLLARFLKSSRERRMRADEDATAGGTYGGRETYGSAGTYGPGGTYGGGAQYGAGAEGYRSPDYRSPETYRSADPYRSAETYRAGGEPHRGSETQRGGEYRGPGGSEGYRGSEGQRGGQRSEPFRADPSKEGRGSKPYRQGSDIETDRTNPGGTL